jgi:hypothetical protein
MDDGLSARVWINYKPGVVQPRRSSVSYRLFTSKALVALTAIVASNVFGQAPSPTTKAVKTDSSSRWNPPKTPWGDPDLQGIWPSTSMIGVPLQRDPKLGERTVLTDEEFAQRETQRKRQSESDGEEFLKDNTTVTIGPPAYWTERGKPSRQASLIVDPPDGRIPPLTADAQNLAAERDADFLRRWGVPRKVHGPRDSWIDDELAFVEPAEHNLYDRCISRGVMGSVLPVIYNDGNRILQAPGQVVIQYEMIHETRIIPLNGSPHAAPAIRSYMGDPRGHWEGNTLVVETTNLMGNRNGIALNGGNTPHSDALLLTERFTRTDENTIQYQATINDPKTYTKPWKVSFQMKRDPDYQMVEYACHEGNYALRDILSGRRVQENVAGTRSK